MSQYPYFFIAHSIRSQEDKKVIHSAYQKYLELYPEIEEIRQNFPEYERQGDFERIDFHLEAIEETLYPVCQEAGLFD